MNAVFENTMENVDNRSDKTGKGLWGLLRKLSDQIFNESSVAIHLDIMKVRYFKPIYVHFGNYQKQYSRIFIFKDF